jgi:hypothetical protein
METNNEKLEFSHEDGLKTIYAMIRMTKGKIGENYLYYLLWGYLVILACILDFLFIRVVNFRQSYLVWPVLMGIGLAMTGIFAWRQQKIQKHRTFIGNIMGYLWMGWLFTFMILLLFLIRRGEYGLILPTCMVMYGLGIFVSGGVISFRPLIAGGIVSWLTAMLAYFQPRDMQLLIMTATVILGYLIPGYMLRYAAKKQKP